MKIVIKKLPWVLMALVLVAGCAGPNSQMKASVEEAAVARVLSVKGEELPDRVRLTIEGTAPLAYTVFRLSEPTRLIIDLADTDVTQLDSVIAIGLGNVSSVQPEQFDEEAGRIGRLEVALIEVWDYETSRVENEIVIDFIKPVAVTQTGAAIKESVDEQAAAPDVDEAPMAGAETVEVVELSIPEETGEPTPEYVAPPLDPASSIDRVMFYEEDGHFSVELVADGAVGRYDALSLAAPPRLVVDVWDVVKGFKPSSIPVEMSGVNRIRVGEHPQEGKLRFVMDLETDTVPPYTLETRGDRLVVTLGLEGSDVMAEVAESAPPAVESTAVEQTATESVQTAPEVEPAPVVEAAVVVTPEPQSEEPAAPPGPSVTDIRYRSEDGGGAVLIIADSSVEFTITQPDTRHLLVDLEGTVLPANLVRSQDTRDVGGPLMALSSFNPKGEKGARISLTFEPGTSFETEQRGGTLTLVLTAPETPEPPVTVAAVAVPVMETAAGDSSTDVIPASVAAPAPEKAPGKTMEEGIVIRKKGPRYTGELMTLDFQNADILNVLRLVAEVSGLNLITGPGVSGKISMRMVDVPWDQALDVILKTKGLGQVKEGNVVRIAPMQELEAERTAALRAKEAQVQAEDLILRIVPLSYSKADAVVGQVTPFLGTRGSINTDVRTNSLIIKDIEENVNRIESLVGELDIPTPQVRIEARIVIVDENYSRNLGIKWGGHAVTDNGTQVFGNAGVADAAYGGGDFMVNLPAANPTSVLGVSFGQIGNFTNLDFRLSAMEQQGKGKIISSPTLMVIQNEVASIEVNNPFPENRTSTNVTQDGTTTTTEVSFPDIWTKLKIVPQVTSNKDIFMEVAVEKDSKGQQATFENNTFTGVNTHKLETKIIIQNNGTAVIGGVYTEQKKDGKSNVPYFSKIPVLGNLFKSTSKESIREELLIFINASIVEG